MTSDNSRRPVNLTPLVMGLVFIGTAVLAVLYAIDAMTLGIARWAFPALLVAAGLVGVIITVMRGHGSGGPAQQASADSDDEYPDDGPYPNPYRDLHR